MFRFSTDQTAPYCYGYTYPQLTATMFLCDSTSATTWDTVLTSSNGDTAGHSFLPQYYTSLAAASSSPFSRSISTSSSTTSPPAPIPPATSTPATSHNSVAAPIAGVVVAR